MIQGKVTAVTFKTKLVSRSVLEGRISGTLIVRKEVFASLILCGIMGVVETYDASLNGGISEEVRIKEKVTVAGTDVIKAVITILIGKEGLVFRPENRQGQGNLGVSISV